MPCFKCSNGKWKFGKKGRCQFNSKSHCQGAERAINAKKGKVKKGKSYDSNRQ